MCRSFARSLLSAVLFTILICAEQETEARPSDRQWQTGLSDHLSSLPLAFTANRGQWDDSVLFRADAGGAVFWFTAEGAYYQFTRRVDDSPQVSSQYRRTTIESGRYESIVIKANFVGANPMPQLDGEDTLGYKCNYFIGKDRAAWRTDVPNFRAVVYKDIYPGIDLKYYGNGKQMEYEFVVSCGVDPSQVQVRYDGARSVQVDAIGRLVVTTDWGEVIEQQPNVYQIADGRRQAVTGKYVLRGNNTFAFELTGDYDPSLTIVIDPILSYSTYLGASGDDYGSITVD
jgi:hypothetical protein